MFLSRISILVLNCTLASKYKKAGDGENGASCDDTNEQITPFCISSSSKSVERSLTIKCMTLYVLCYLTFYLQPSPLREAQRACGILIMHY